jgi:hypothetical protein
MPIEPSHILDVLDRCRDRFTFPMLDNGYVYLAATRLSLFRSPQDWAMVIEVFGFSPRAGAPDTTIQTFASRLHNRNPAKDYVNDEAHEAYLANNPHNELRTVFPIVDDSWQDEEDVAERSREVIVRGRRIPLPHADDYARNGIDLEDPPRVRVFEACRYLAAVARDLVLATPEERRVSVLPGMEQILQLEEWNHPDVVEESPSQSQTFRQLARVLAAGDTTLYRPTLPPNTHWQHWPEGGTL